MRDATRLGYPFEESIRSLLPLVDELVVAVGRSEHADDETWATIAAMAQTEPRITPFLTEWPAPRGGGDVLSQQTNLALARCTGDWAVYLQADEVLHEDDRDLARAAMQRHLPRRTEGLLFRYRHFWKHYGTVSDDWTAFYPRAVRIVRLGAGIESAGDACGFVARRHGRTRGLLKADTGARVFHYGWCNPPETQAIKNGNLTAIYAMTPDRDVTAGNVFGTLRLKPFRGTHPAVMQARVRRAMEPPPARGSFIPASVHAAAALLRTPSAARGWARPLLPVALTNTWWSMKDFFAR